MKAAPKPRGFDIARQVHALRTDTRAFSAQTMEQARRQADWWLEQGAEAAVLRDAAPAARHALLHEYVCTGFRPLELDGEPVEWADLP